MSPRSYHLESAPSPIPNNVDAGSVCVYSKTRRRFICADVEAGDFSNSSLDIRLLGIGPDSARGLWLNPFWGIPPTSLSVPVDLIYLDQDCFVLDVVDCFPLAEASESTSPPASVLVLPADSVRATGTEIGDRLVICPREEMKRRLKNLSGADSKPRPDQTNSASGESPAPASTARVLSWEGKAAARSIQEKVMAVFRPADPQPEPKPEIEQQLVIRERRKSTPAVDASEATQAQTREIAESSGTGDSAELFKAFVPSAPQATPAQSWLKRIFAQGPVERRRSPRGSIEGMVAYFFTGGFPVPHEVRDISATGAYVYTQERWYPGTIVRLTLTYVCEPGSERSISLDSSVVGNGDDGVGLQFVFADQSGSAQQTDNAMMSSSRRQVKQFLQHLRKGASNSRRHVSEG